MHPIHHIESLISRNRAVQLDFVNVEILMNVSFPNLISSISLSLNDYHKNGSLNWHIEEEINFIVKTVKIFWNRRKALYFCLTIFRSEKYF